MPPADVPSNIKSTAMHAENQRLEARTTTELLVSLQQNKKREAAKQKQESGKRPASASAGLGPASKRQQKSKVTAEPILDEQPEFQTLQYTIQQLQSKTLKELTVRSQWWRLSCSLAAANTSSQQDQASLDKGLTNLVCVVWCRRL